jgi:serine/threonine-protein kinase
MAESSQSHHESGAEESETPLVPVTRIGRYEIVRVIGQGGMGRVLLGRDSVLGRLVALKVLRDDLGLMPALRLELFDRMRHEARAAAALSHPNIVTLHDMGEEPAVGLYLVFEYVDGATLRDRLANGPLDAPTVARMARELGDALTVAHESGVIHRDLKPENVLLPRTGAKLADFGIARLPDSTLTGVGVVLGTPAYGAPEGLALAEFSPATDQFSFASTLYEAITGERAFTGEDAFAIAARVATEQPPPIPADATFDARLANIVLSRAMSKDPKNRYASCREFGAAFAEALERRPPVLVLPSVEQAPQSVTRSSIAPAHGPTLRGQNIAAGVGLLVIICLALIGHRAEEPEGDGASLKSASSAFAAKVDGHSAPHPHPPEHASSRPHAPTDVPSTTDGGVLDALQAAEAGATDLER